MQVQNVPSWLQTPAGELINQYSILKTLHISKSPRYGSSAILWTAMWSIRMQLQAMEHLSLDLPVESMILLFFCSLLKLIDCKKSYMNKGESILQKCMMCTLSKINMLDAWVQFSKLSIIKWHKHYITVIHILQFRVTVYPCRISMTLNEGTGLIST